MAEERSDDEGALVNEPMPGERPMKRRLSVRMRTATTRVREQPNMLRRQ